MTAQELTFHWTIATPSGQIVYERDFEEAGALPSLDQDIPVGADFEVIVAIDVSQVKAIQIGANGALTIKTNSTSSPGNTLTLVANVPYQWHEDAYNALKLTVDVVKFYITNSGLIPVRLTLRGLYDPTL